MWKRGFNRVEIGRAQRDLAFNRQAQRTPPWDQRAKLPSHLNGPLAKGPLMQRHVEILERQAQCVAVREYQLSVNAWRGLWGWSQVHSARGKHTAGHQLENEAVLATASGTADLLGDLLNPSGVDALDVQHSGAHGSDL
jgi:hypothetical protein